MSKVINIVLAMFLAFSISACKTITLDEGIVFQPGQFGGNETGPRTSKLRYESVLLEPMDLVIDVWADGQKAKHIIQSEDFVKSEVSHDVIDYDGEHLGITLVERPNLSPPGSARPLVVHCGGNASDRYETATLYAQKIIQTADVLLFDYPGYGESSGQATAESLKAANQTIAKFVRSNIQPRQNLILWGHSLGGFVCADMAQYFTSLDGIVLETSATNAEDVSKAVVPWFAKPFIKLRVVDSLKAYDAVEMLRTVDAPILVLGAAKDKTLPVELSRGLAEGLKAAGRDVTYVEFRKGNHISLPTQNGFLETIQNFIETLGDEPSNLRRTDILSFTP